ncbi:hypothetical protein [Rhodovulum sulfidophilum]|uniref:hypothetical protein n=2 Tax=Rhodovulum sulfidophilum TaxID=35806 RepID=UPI0012DAA826|nr:hypothetical protein [Rhodovulum sulfidophilum]MBL3559370.1 hypothetical protein [Rhodovulum sulfidophilum]MBL3567644.1 hypothetical protein [Rhodovulum sulfidophilum]MBL3572746.1 hypothetical protein [Rhodovulum sulfidophilum]MCE8433136.1 hypothetical protein [Rhodovulum sulfidophilum]MCW2301917.1 ferric-dicitrate binding protein FerR (iron transport regulator) [Rhodovulum sulfidophilum]
MTEPRMKDEALEALFEAARQDRSEPSAALMARIMDDAMVTAAAGRSAGRSLPRRARMRRGVPALLLAAIGGWPALAGVAAAGVFGLWIGYAGPGDVGRLSTEILGSAYGPDDLMSSLDTYLTEG